MSNVQSNNKNPYIKILEQPSTKGVRFRYECERSFAGIIMGEYSTPLKKSFPTIQIVNYRGPAFIVVSCVTANPPHWPHPHNLVGKGKEVSNGICYFKTDTEDMIVSFPNFGIQCVKKKDIEKSLAVRQKLKVDPFNTGFSHVSNPDNIDLYCIRLCFQAFLEGQEKGKFNIPLQPVISRQVLDKSKIKSEPTINFLSHISASVAGGTEMCILCEKASKEDIEVRFFREENEWEAIAEFTPPSVYKQVSIVFKSPKYVVQDVSEPVRVNVQLRRISDGVTSQPIPFRFLPLQPHEGGSISRKRQRDKDNAVSKQIQEEAAKNADLIRLAQTGSTSVVEARPWELPPYIMNAQNDANMLRDQVTMSVNTSADGSQHFGADNINVAKKQSMRNGKMQLNIAQHSLHTSQQLQQTQNSSDTLNSDSWIKELFETIDESSADPTMLPNNVNNINKVAYEPETHFIPIDSSLPVNAQSVNNLLDMGVNQRDDYQDLNNRMGGANTNNNENDIMKNITYPVQEYTTSNISNAMEIPSESRIPFAGESSVVLSSQIDLNRPDCASSKTYYTLDNHRMLYRRKDQECSEKPLNLVYKHLQTEDINMHSRNVANSCDFKMEKTNIPSLPGNLTTTVQQSTIYSHLNNNINTFSEEPKIASNGYFKTQDYHNTDQMTQWNQMEKYSVQNSHSWQTSNRCDTLTMKN